MNITILGAHNCESKQTRMSGVLIDDVLALDAGSLTSTLSFAEQQKLQAVMLTHQHYDHIRDIPALAMNLFLTGKSIRLYATEVIREALLSHLLDGQIYPNFLERPENNPTLKLNVVESLHPWQVGGYHITAIPVSHAVPAVGYQVSSPDGKTVFYTGDTGPGLADSLGQVSPQLIITEVTASNRFEEFGKESKHLTPSLLKVELIRFRDLKGYLPSVVMVHMNPDLEAEIKAEANAVARELNVEIIPGYEGMKLSV